MHEMQTSIKQKHDMHELPKKKRKTNLKPWVVSQEALSYSPR